MEEMFFNKRLCLISPKGTKYSMLTKVAKIDLVKYYIEPLGFQNYSFDGRVIKVSSFMFVTYGIIKVELVKMRSNRVRVNNV
jgi:hypothetical protein